MLFPCSVWSVIKRSRDFKWNRGKILSPFFRFSTRAGWAWSKQNSYLLKKSFEASFKDGNTEADKQFLSSYSRADALLKTEFWQVKFPGYWIVCDLVCSIQPYPVSLRLAIFWTSGDLLCFRSGFGSRQPSTASASTERVLSYVFTTELALKLYLELCALFIGARLFSTFI